MGKNTNSKPSEIINCIDSITNENNESLIEKSSKIDMEKDPPVVINANSDANNNNTPLREDIFDKDKIITDLKTQLNSKKLTIEGLTKKYLETKDKLAYLSISNLEKEEKIVILLNTINTLKITSHQLPEARIKNENNLTLKPNIIKEIENLKEKNAKLKEMSQEWKTKFEDELNKTKKNHSDKILEISRKLESSMKKEIDLISNSNIIKEKYQNLKEQYTHLMKEKNELSDIVIKQEEKLSNLVEKILDLEKHCDNKNKIIKKTDIYVNELINIIEEQKSQIQFWKNKLREKSLNTYNDSLYHQQCQSDKRLLSKEVISKYQRTKQISTITNDYVINNCNSNNTDLVWPNIGNIINSNQERGKDETKDDEENNKEQLLDFQNRIDKLISELN